MNNLDLERQNLDEQRQMRNLVNAIEFADSFSLLFVRCNQRSRQLEIIEELKNRLIDLKITVIFLENKIDNLLDELDKRLGDEKPDAVFVYGLESSFPEAETSAQLEFVVTLNHSRNSYKKRLHCPLVLFLPEYALSAIYHGATDFYSIRSGVYLFSAKAEEIEFQISQYNAAGYRELEGLVFEDRQNRIKTIEGLLEEYQSLPDVQRNLEKEFNLKAKLANLYDISGKYDKAFRLYEDTLAYAQKVQDLKLISLSLSGLGSIYQDNRDYSEALKKFIRSLEVNKEIFGEDHPNYASSLNNLSGVYSDLKKNQEAIDLLKKSLEIFEKTLGKKNPEYLTSLGNLAAIYHAQGKYAEAISLYEEAVKIDRDLFTINHPNHALRLSNLSRLYFDLEEYQKALSLANEVYQIRSKTLGINHPDTKDIKNGMAMIRAKIREKASVLVPFKK